MAKMLSPRPDGYPVYVAGGLHDGTITGPIDPAPDDHMLGHCVMLCFHPRSRSLGMSSALARTRSHPLRIADGTFASLCLSLLWQSGRSSSLCESR